MDLGRMGTNEDIVQKKSEFGEGWERMRTLCMVQEGCETTST
jgi:hypothetical protein